MWDRALAGRAVFEHRAVVLGAARGELWVVLRRWRAGSFAPGVVRGVAPLAGGGLAFVFTGQGAQRVGMGASCMRRRGCSGMRWMRSARSYDARVGLFVVGGDVRVLRAAVTGAGLLDRTLFAQAGLFALEVSLFRLVESWGVRA